MAQRNFIRGLILSCLLSVIAGIFLFREVYSFSSPGAPSGAGLGPSTGKLGNPASFGVSSIFAGQKKIFDEIVARCGAAVSTGNPIAALNAVPTAGDKPLTVFFAGIGNDDGGTITSYSWDFGDGSPFSTAQNPSHIYNTGGNFIARLTVIDNNANTNTATLSAIVVTNNETFTCADVVDTMGGGCTNIAGGFSLSAGSGLFLGGRSFDDNDAGAGFYQPRNVCLIARYGNGGSYQTIPTDASRGYPAGPYTNHWFGICGPGTCSTCLNDHILTPGEQVNTSTFDYDTTTCGLPNQTDTDASWTQVDCYWP